MPNGVFGSCIRLASLNVSGRFSAVLSKRNTVRIMSRMYSDKCKSDQCSSSLSSDGDENSNHNWNLYEKLVSSNMSSFESVSPVESDTEEEDDSDECSDRKDHHRFYYEQHSVSRRKRS